MSAEKKRNQNASSLITKSSKTREDDHLIQDSKDQIRKAIIFYDFLLQEIRRDIYIFFSLNVGYYIALCIATFLANMEPGSTITTIGSGLLVVLGSTANISGIKNSLEEIFKDRRKINDSVHRFRFRLDSCNDIEGLGKLNAIIDKAVRSTQQDPEDFLKELTEIINTL